MTSWLEARAARTPAGLALRGGDGDCCWAELADRARRCAEALRAAGAGPGRPVGLLLGNHPDFVAWLHAATLCRAEILPLSPRHTEAEQTFALDDVGTRWLVHGDGALADRADALARLRPALERIDSRVLPTRGRPATRFTPSRRNDPLALLHTSGTTGRPKAAVLTCGNLEAAARASATHLGSPPDERWLACMPLHHVGGLAILVRSVLFGSPVVLHDRFDAERVAQALEGDGITIASLVPTMLRRLLEAWGDRPAPATLRCALIGGGPAAPELLEAAWKRGWPALPTYGLTEACAQVATLRPDEIGRQPGATGRALPGIELEIRDADGRTLAAGEAGEICVRGPTLMTGYRGRPAETRRSLRDGWLHTGDLGRLDGEGFLRVLDRRSDLILTGGENVYPAEVEAALIGHPDVVDAGVAAEPDPEFGQRVAAWVVLRDGARLDAGVLRAWVRQRLAAYKVPRSVRALPELPRTASGKLRRAALRRDCGA